jgi:putative lipoic acid-binding regulatory protein
MMQDSQQVYEFPCLLSIKVIGEDRDGFLKFVIDTISEIVGAIEENAITTKKSGGDKYLAVTVPFTAQDREQLEAVYQALNQDNRTRFLI